MLILLICFFGIFLGHCLVEKFAPDVSHCTAAGMISGKVDVDEVFASTSHKQLKNPEKTDKKLCKNKYAVTTVTVIAIYYMLEVYLYTSAKYSFNKLECMDQNACVKILLVADPQLIGLHNEIVRPLTGLAIFDIDRYLSRTYQVAFDFIKPDVVVFLGDLFDEGSTASQTEFDSYHNRFHKIYGKPSQTLQHIYLPGDNDIGGEGYDVVTLEKVLRFYRAFNQSDTLQIKTLTFYKYNRLTKTVVQPLARRVSDEEVYVNVGLSHIPFLHNDNEYILNMVATTHPHVIFSAHEHVAAIIELDKEVGLREKIQVAAEANKVYQYSLSDDKMYEFLVPTASYRMGTNKIGHGYVIIEEDRLFFTVLWSPQRFPQLILYGVLLLISILYGICTVCKICLIRRPKKRPAFV